MEREGPPLSGQEAARELGVSYQTLMQAVKRGQIPVPFKLGNLYRFPRRIIWALINGEFNQPPSEP